MSHSGAARLAVWQMRDANVKCILEVWISPQTVQGERDGPLMKKCIWEMLNGSPVPSLKTIDVIRASFLIVVYSRASVCFIAEIMF